MSTLKNKIMATKKYTKGEFTVNWDSSKCQHAAECVKNAGKVFLPKEQPWIQMENDTTETIKAAIDKCPSGALSY